MSGAGDPERARQAMAAVDEQLVRRDDGLILLFTPPFDKGTLQPGYIKGYVPGIRENGGQYTHAATWVVQAAGPARPGRSAPGAIRPAQPGPAHADAGGRWRSYKVEPYVVAADIYGEPPHIGRGGWTWYTGSAAWLYRVALEVDPRLPSARRPAGVDPCVPRGWPSFEISYRYRSAMYHLTVVNGGSGRRVSGVNVDGRLVEGGWLLWPTTAAAMRCAGCWSDAPMRFEERSSSLRGRVSA